jgi:cobalamin biosynthesis protein CobC
MNSDAPMHASTPRDHGGDIGAAVARFGGSEAEWIDLSTGINQMPYPLPDIPPAAWHCLPTRGAMDQLVAAARDAYGSHAPLVPLAGAQAAIQMIPRLGGAGRAVVLAPTYNEYASALTAQGWEVREHNRLEALCGADLAVVVNPNNPDGRVHAPDDLIALSKEVGLLIVDESFADPTPSISIASRAGTERFVVLRSFGTFYGLAGIRLGFALGPADIIRSLAELAGPWAVSGPALVAGAIALRDPSWAQSNRGRLARDAAALDALVAGAGWTLVGGTPLFRLFDTEDAAAAQAMLARRRIWSRTFPWSRRLIRLGIPAGDTQWQAVQETLRQGRD